MRGESTPKPCEAASASPESFSRTRLNIGWGMAFQILSQTKKGTFRRPQLLSFLFRLRDRDGLANVANFEAGEAPDRNILTQLANLCSDQLRDRLRLFLDERLLVEANLLVELCHLA